MTVEDQLVGYLHGLRYESLPVEVIEATRNMLFWTLGTAVAGSVARGSSEVEDFARQSGGSGPCTILQYGSRAGLLDAGFANGTFAKALEYEDKLWIDGAHGYCVSGAVVPAAIAMAESIGQVDGRQFLTAVAGAVELESRMILSVSRAIESGWNSTYLYSSIGAALVGAKLLNLSEEQTLNALGIAYAQCAGNRQAHVEAVQGVRMQMGFGVRNGLASAALAVRNLTGSHEPLTGMFGLYALFWPDKDVDPERLVDRLGSEYELLGIGFKAHPCGAVAHPALDALIELREREDFDHREVVSIRVQGTERLWVMVEPADHRRRPRNVVELQFSLPWVLACAAVDGQLALSHLTDAAFRDHRYRNLAAKVQATMGSEDGATRVWVELRDGRILESRSVSIPSGHPRQPLSPTRIRSVFRECLEYGLGPGQGSTEGAVEFLETIEEVDDVSGIMHFLVSA